MCYRFVESRLTLYSGTFKFCWWCVGFGGFAVVCVDDLVVGPATSSRSNFDPRIAVTQNVRTYSILPEFVAACSCFVSPCLAWHTIGAGATKESGVELT